MNDYERLIENKIIEFVNTDPRNVLVAHNNMKIYDEPLIGIADADDDYFREFQKQNIIGKNFIPPNGWLNGAQSVISYFLPFTKEIRDTNLMPGMPSQEWMSARIDGEKFNNAVRTFIVEELKKMNAHAIAPSLDKHFKIEEIISNWSERHVAFAAGLGTFGLHRAVITSKGTTGRFGSVVTTLKLKPTQRDYTKYFEYCPHITQGKCGACIAKCPINAISKNGKNNKMCSEYIDKEILSIYAPRYGCAKCNMGVPCEYRIPINTK